MATYTSNYAWTKPSGNDNVDISVLNDNLDSQDSVMHDAFMNMAQAFSESSTYEVGDIVVYGTTTYKCHTAVTTAGSWTGSTNWQVYKLSEGGSGGLTLGETSSTAYRGDRGKVAYDHSQTIGNPHGTTAADVGLGNVPNVATDDQTPTFTTAQSRNNLVSGEKISVMLGKISKFFNDLKTVAFTGSYSDLATKLGIKNSAGTDLTARNTLQFTGGLAVSDDSTNNRTVVSGDYELITWENWQTIVANHEEILHPNAIITDVPDADGNISVDLMTKLWENPSPTSAMASGNIQLSSDDYDFLIYLYKVKKDTNRYCSVMSPKGSGALLFTGDYSSNLASNRTRAVGYVSDTSLNVGDARINGTVDNDVCILTTIYGIKTTASVKVSAIAESVSTSADKCMLSDGVTSVEDVVECTQITAGNYRLRATVGAGGAVTYSWVAE